MLLQTPAPCFQLHMCASVCMSDQPSVSADKPVTEASWASGAEQKLSSFPLGVSPVYLICPFSGLWSILKQTANIKQWVLIGIFLNPHICVHKKSVRVCVNVCGCVYAESTNSGTLCWSRQQIVFHTEPCYIDCISLKLPLIRVTMIHLTAHLQFTQLQRREPWSKLQSVVLTALFLLTFNYSFCHVCNKSLHKARTLSYMHIQTLPFRCPGWTITFFISSKRSPRISRKDPSHERKSS